jgi:hypothetical protein
MLYLQWFVYRYLLFKPDRSVGFLAPEALLTPFMSHKYTQKRASFLHRLLPHWCFWWTMLINFSGSCREELLKLIDEQKAKITGQ